MEYPALAIVVAVLAAFAVANLAGSLIGRAGFPLPPAEGRLGCVDGLRGYLALSVLAHHFIIWLQVTRLGGGWVAPTVPAFNQLGAGAVGLFFMTTGLVFYRRVLTGFRRTSWPAVYVTRVFRIMPLMLLSIAMVAVIASLRTGQPLGRGDLPALLRYVTTWNEPGLAGDPIAGRSNAYVLWSLRFEWLFYILVLPASAAAADMVRGRLPSFVVPAAVLAAAALGTVAERAGAQAVPLVPWLPLFAAGMFAYEARLRPALAGWLRGRAAASLAAGALILTCLVFPSPVPAALPAFAFFFACVACGNRFFGLMDSAGALVAGEVSFSVYLVHGTVLSLFFVEGGRLTDGVPVGVLPLFLPVIAVLTVLVSCATYLLVERPATRLGSRIASWWTGTRVRSRLPEVEIAP